MLALTLSVLIPAAAASTGPTSEFTGNTLIILGQVVTMIVAVGGLLVAVRSSNTRQPPVAEEMYKEFARNTELDENVQRIHDRIDKTQNSIKDLHRDMSKGFQDVERALGRVEGRQDKSHES